MVRSPRTVPLEEYLAFLPDERRRHAVRPISRWWRWCGHRVRLLGAPDAAAPVRILLVHGAGAHGEALWPVASQIVPLGAEVTAVDLPCYGDTVTADRSRVRYQDWVDLLVDLVRAEEDGRPLILLGGSIGGLLAAEAAAQGGGVCAVAATCLLDPLDADARVRMTRWGRLGAATMPLLRWVRGPMGRIPVRVSWVAHLARMGRDPALGALCAQDARGGGALVPLGLLASYLRHPHAAARRSQVPVTLVHPELDAWTPPALSLRTLSTLPGAQEPVLLRDSGHFPVEGPGLQDLEQVMRALIDRVAS